MKMLSLTLQIALVGAAVSQASAADISSHKDLGTALEQAVQCKAGAADAFDAREPRVRRNLVRLGVQVAGDTDDGPWDFKYRLPAEISVFGHAAKDAGYSGDSGSLFYVRLAGDEADLAKLRDALRLSPIPPSHASDYADDAKYYRPVHPPTKDDPYPDTVTAGLAHDNSGSYVVIGCQTFDY